MKSGTTLVTFLLDETGSMESIKDDTIGGFNSYVDSLRDETHGEVEFTLLKFDSRRVAKVYVGVPISEVERLDHRSYQPGAATPLIDATFKAIKATEEVVAKRQDSPNVLCVIQTDGHENASTEHTFVELATLIKEKEAAGWVFVFLGAGVDAFDIGVRQMGVSASNAMSYGRQNSKAAFAAMASNTAQLRATGNASAMAFSDEQRGDAGDADLSSGPLASKPVPAGKIVDDIKLTT